MPLVRRLPKRGFANIFREEYVEVNVGRLAGLAAKHRSDAGDVGGPRTDFPEGKPAGQTPRQGRSGRGFEN